MKPLASASLLTSLVLGVNLALSPPAKAESEAAWKPLEASKTQTQSLSQESPVHRTEQTPTDGSDSHLTSQPANELDLATLNAPSTSNSVTAQTAALELESSLKLLEANPSSSLPIDQITSVAQLSEVQSTQSSSQEQEMPDDMTSSPNDPIIPVSQLSEVQSTQSSAQEQEMSEDTTSSPMEQVTGVTQLSDVQPSDWAFEALRSLVERYGCIAGYPDGTFRGNRAMTRYEFAAGLNACLNQIERLIGSNAADFVTKDDLARLQRLQEEFKVELASLGTRVDGLEERVAGLEDNQFSTTTKLNGRIEFGLVRAFGDKKAVPSGQIPSQDLNENLVLGSTAILSFNTSFTGKDRLTTTLTAGNINVFGVEVTGTDMTKLDFGLRTLGGAQQTTDNNVILGPLVYQFPIGNSARGVIAARGMSFGRVLPNINYAATISSFGTGNPFYLFLPGIPGPPGTAGGGIQYQINDKIGIGAAYIFNNPANPSSGGLFGNGGYGAAAQLTLKPFKGFDAALMYAHLYAPDGAITGRSGSQFAQFPFGRRTATSVDALSLELGWTFSRQFGVGIWGGYLSANAESSPRVNGVNASRGADGDIWYWALATVNRDLLLRGTELGFVFGMPPKLSANEAIARRDRDTSYHIEGYFSFPLARNPVTNAVRAYLTPGFVGILNPEHNSENNDIWIGTVVLTFYF